MCHLGLSHWGSWSHGNFIPEIPLLALTTCLTNAPTLHPSPSPLVTSASVFHFPVSTPHFWWGTIKDRATKYQPHSLGTPFAIPRPLSSRNTSLCSVLALFPHLDGFFPKCFAAFGMQSTGAHSTGHGRVGALWIINPVLVERCAWRDGWIMSNPGGNEEKWHSLPWYGYSQLPAWQDNTTKWENNEMSSCSLEIWEILTISNIRHGFI